MTAFTEHIMIVYGVIPAIMFLLLWLSVSILVVAFFINLIAAELETSPNFFDIVKRITKKY